MMQLQSRPSFINGGNLPYRIYRQRATPTTTEAPMWESFLDAINPMNLFRSSDEAERRSSVAQDHRLPLRHQYRSSEDVMYYTEQNQPTDLERYAALGYSDAPHRISNINRDYEGPTLASQTRFLKNRRQSKSGSWVPISNRRADDTSRMQYTKGRINYANRSNPRNLEGTIFSPPKETLQENIREEITQSHDPRLKNFEFKESFPLRDDLYIGKDGNIYIKDSSKSTAHKNNNQSDRIHALRESDRFLEKTNLVSRRMDRIDNLMNTKYKNSKATKRESRSSPTSDSQDFKYSRQRETAHKRPLRLMSDDNPSKKYAKSSKLTSAKVKVESQTLKD